MSKRARLSAKSHSFNHYFTCCRPSRAYSDSSSSSSCLEVDDHESEHRIVLAALVLGYSKAIRHCPLHQRDDPFFFLVVIKVFKGFSLLSLLSKVFKTGKIRLCMSFYEIDCEVILILGRQSRPGQDRLMGSVDLIDAKKITIV